MMFFPRDVTGIIVSYVEQPVTHVFAKYNTVYRYKDTVYNQYFINRLLHPEYILIYTLKYIDSTLYLFYAVRNKIYIKNLFNNKIVKIINFRNNVEQLEYGKLLVVCCSGVMLIDFDRYFNITQRIHIKIPYGNKLLHAGKNIIILETRAPGGLPYQKFFDYNGDFLKQTSFLMGEVAYNDGRLLTRLAEKFIYEINESTLEVIPLDGSANRGCVVQ
jgi:hypothetical protein